MSRSIDFNCDLGEGCGDDAAILPLISSANIACGLHAGDAATMATTIAGCIRHHVAIGAHPGFADREGFGRREGALDPRSIRELLLYQLGALAALTRDAGARMSHVKPHGALYNIVARDRGVADALASAVRDFDPQLLLYGLAGSALIDAGRAAGLCVINEVFAERRYEADGQLTPRSHPDAVIDSLDESVTQTIGLLRDGQVTARTGERIAVQADTLCLHGDRPDAADFARTLRSAIAACGLHIAAPGVAP